jgi:GTP-binding protein HflX
MNKDIKNYGIIVSVDKGLPDFSDSLNELVLLCNTLGIIINKIFVQKRKSADTVFYVGKGKITEIREYSENNKDKNLIFNTDLSGIQRKNLEKQLKINILDRSEVILKIFKAHAGTAQSKLQVEIAELQYEMPKLIGKGKDMSRTGGGIGTLGPGETMLEYNRRTIRKKLHFFKKKLDKIEKSRKLLLDKSDTNGTPRIAIAGYTSAGKSTLLKTLTSDDDILVSDSLFSTLSTLSRKVGLPSGLNTVFSDTVGFIRNLPEQLTESFKSTLEHINYSDLIILLIDASDDNYTEKMFSVEKILNDIVRSDIPRLIIFNKIDKISRERINLLKSLYPNAYLLTSVSFGKVFEFLNFLESYLVETKIIKKIDILVPPEKKYLVDRLRGKIGVLSSNSESLTIVGKSSVISRFLSFLNR